MKGVGRVKETISMRNVGSMVAGSTENGCIFIPSSTLHPLNTIDSIIITINPNPNSHPLKFNPLAELLGILA